MSQTHTDEHAPAQGLLPLAQPARGGGVLLQAVVDLRVGDPLADAHPGAEDQRCVVGEPLDAGDRVDGRAAAERERARAHRERTTGAGVRQHERALARAGQRNAARPVQPQLI